MVPNNKSESSVKKEGSHKRGPKRKREPSGSEDVKVPNNQNESNVKKEGSQKSGPKRKREPSGSKDVKVSKKKTQTSTDKRKHETTNPDNANDCDYKNDQSDASDLDEEKHKIYDNDDEEEHYGKFQQFNKEKLWKLKKIPHNVLPSFNMTKHTNIKDIRDSPLMQMSLPHSLYVNSKLPDALDICLRRTTAFYSYMVRLKAVRSSYLSAKKRHKSVRKDEKSGVYCKALVEFAQRREFNPDKYFGRDYDFYYTGGNLSVNPKLGHIAHVGGTNMNTLNLSVFNVKNNQPKIHKITSLEFKSDIKDESEIFEVQSSTSNEDYYFLRQKHCISIQHFTERKFKLKHNFKIKDVPFISLSQDPVNNHHLAISDLVHKVRICDVEKGIPIQSLKMMSRDLIKPSNNWNQIKSLDSHVYIYSSCKKVSIIDTRLPENRWQTNHCGSNLENPCYTFCSLARSQFENLFYVGSNHKVYCVDRRYMGKDIDQKHAAVARWTHQMSSYPLMMATSRHNDAEYIVLQSPLNWDMRICENMQFLPETDMATEVKQEYEYRSPCLPYMPPSLESLFQEGRLQGKCIKQGSGIVDRVKACITGLDFIEDSSNPYLLTATSNGDIFARHMYDPCNVDIKPDTSTADDVITEFEENIFRSARKPPLGITEVCDFKGISKVFRCPFLSVTPLEEPKDMPKRKYMGRWQKSIETLSKYKDALASDLISIWDFEIEEKDKEKDFNIAALNATQVSDSKVSGWLENTVDIQHSTMINMTSVPLGVLDTSNNENSVAADASFNESKNIINSQIDLDESFSFVKPKSAKKKSRYVKGF